MEPLVGVMVGMADFTYTYAGIDFCIVEKLYYNHKVLSDTMLLEKSVLTIEMHD